MLSFEVVTVWVDKKFPVLPVLKKILIRNPEIIQELILRKIKKYYSKKLP